MNFENGNLLAALQSGVATVGVQFPSDRGDRPAWSEGQKVYTYKVPQAWNVQINDWLVVMVSDMPKAVRVSELHGFPRLPRDVDTKWAVTKLDFNFYFNIKQAEEGLSKQLDMLRRRKEAEELLAELRKTMPGDALDGIVNNFAALLGVPTNPALQSAGVAGTQQSQATPVAEQAQQASQQPQTQPPAGNLSAPNIQSHLNPAATQQPVGEQPALQPGQQSWQQPGSQTPSWAK